MYLGDKSSCEALELVQVREQSMGAVDGRRGLISKYSVMQSDGNNIGGYVGYVDSISMVYSDEV